jgi:hypothetical protein
MLTAKEAVPFGKHRVDHRPQNGTSANAAKLHAQINAVEQLPVGECFVIEI